MGKIKKETAEDIWVCYREIEAGEKMLEEMAKLKEQYPREEHAQRLKDSFGRGRDLQLGIPSGKNGHRLYNVSPDLTESVIRAHIADKKARLTKINEIARVELRMTE